MLFVKVQDISDKYNLTQAHEKSVNCGCFDGHGSDKFVTGGDDNCIHVWEVINRKDGFYVRCVLNNS